MNDLASSTWFLMRLVLEQSRAETNTMLAHLGFVTNLVFPSPVLLDRPHVDPSDLSAIPVHWHGSIVVVGCEGFAALVGCKLPILTAFMNYVAPSVRAFCMGRSCLPWKASLQPNMLEKLFESALTVSGKMRLPVDGIWN